MGLGRVGGRSVGRATRRIGGAGRRIGGGIRRTGGGIRRVTRHRPCGRRIGAHQSRFAARRARHAARRGVSRVCRFRVNWGGVRHRRRVGWGLNPTSVFFVGTFGRLRRYGRNGTYALHQAERKRNGLPMEGGGGDYGNYYAQNDAKTQVDPEIYTCFVTVEFSPTAEGVSISEIQPNIKEGKIIPPSENKQQYDVPVPQGLKPGDMFQANVGGQLMQVQVPLDKGPPGVPVPANTMARVWGPSSNTGQSPGQTTQLMEITVPPGFGPGMMLQFQTVEGKAMEVLIPAGATSGSTFQLHVPQNVQSPVLSPEVNNPEASKEPPKNPRIVDGEFGADENGIQATVPESITVQDFLIALENAQLVQTTDGAELDLTSLNVGVDTYDENDTRLLKDILKSSGQRVEVEGFVVPPEQAAQCCTII
mmetsp:Transcript_415/g.1012  ORF Transcript_415/g.1012 Transcript_415/m.1012 type:complete len:421 (-) Transcript_415:151-1413(-)